MPEVVLAGPDGAPSIDAATGMPLTMEELLRRRGILGVKGVVSPLNQSPVGTTDASIAQQALAEASNATTANSSGSAAEIGASPQRTDANGVAIGATPATPKVVPVSPAPDDGSDGSMWPWAIGGAGLAGAYAYSKLRRRGGRTPIDADINSVVSPRFYREPIIEDAQWEEINPGSNRKLDPLLDGRNASHAEQIGAGPKSLAGAAPVTDVANDNTLTSAVATRRLQDYNTRAPVSSRVQNAARQSNQSRVQPTGTNPIRLQDGYTDLDESEMGLARQLASRIRTDREIGQTRGVGSRRAGSGIAPAPVYDQGSELAEAVAIVRAARARGVNTHALMPLVRRLRP